MCLPSVFLIEATHFNPGTILWNMLMRPLFTLALPDVVIQALRKGGYRYFEDLLNHDGVLKENVTELLGKFNYNPSDLMNLAAPSLIDTAGQLLQNEALISRIPTFSQSFDRILGGGVPSGSILQIYGGPGSGKTQFLLQLCVNVQLPECFGGLEGASIFIDTDLGFSPSRLTEIAKGAVCHCTRIASVHHMEDEVRTFSVETILSRVYYMTVKNHIELIAAVEQLNVFIPKNPKVKFVAIDSLIFPFLTMNNSLERTRVIYLIINKLSLIADKFNIAVVFSNHITTKIINNTKLLAQALGESLGHRVTQSLLLAKVDESFSAVLSKSSTGPEVVIQFTITKEGIRDLQETESV
uniref:DNA repair protein RAD51 homolog 3 n=2 Tax=Lygus hesperus TaxID=30085 RepID=A0A146LZB4_LYGHE